jgi:hypothetical protein
MLKETYCPTWSNNPHDYHIKNRQREDPNSYIAEHVHDEQLFLRPDDIAYDSVTAPS